MWSCVTSEVKRELAAELDRDAKRLRQARTIE
jgi:hypothetical protein